MAGVPGPDDVPQVGLRNTQDVVPVPGSAIVRSRAALADAGVALTERITDQQNELALARADIDAARELEAIRVRMLTDNDWQSQPTRARAEADTVLKTHGERLRGDQTQRAWQVRSGQRLNEFSSGMLQQSRERGADLARADLVALQTHALEVAGDLSLGEDVRQIAVRNYAGALERAQAAGLIAPDWAAADQARFAEAVRGRVQEGLRAEFVERLDLDPDDLATDIEDDEGPFRVMPPDDRARMARQARQQAAQFAIDDVLEETLTSGVIVGEDDPRLAGIWAHLGANARLDYARNAANARDLHDTAAAMGDLTGLSMAEILVRADEAQANNNRATSFAAGVHVASMRADPAAYALQNTPNLSLLQQRASQAVAAAQAAPDDSEARINAVRARQAYVIASMEAQMALGLPSTQVRIHTAGQVGDWARRVRRHAPDQQQALLDALPAQMLRMYGDEALAERAVEEHTDAYYRAQNQGMAAPPPDPAVAAAQGADYDVLRGRILRALRNGSDLDDPVLDTMIGRLSPADRTRLMQDPEIAQAGAQ